MTADQLQKIYRLIINIGQFPKQERYNITNDKKQLPRGVVLGLIKLRPCDSIEKGIDIYPSKPSFRPKYSELHAECEKLMWDYDPTFDFTTIQINDNQICAKHKDANNVGVSYIIGLGDYDGGELRVWNKTGDDYEDLNIKNKFVSFDGSQFFHETLPFKGKRYTLVYYKV